MVSCLRRFRLRSEIQRFCLLLVVVCFSYSFCMAADDSVFEVYDPKTKKMISCKKVRGKWEAGDSLKKTIQFKPYKDVITKLKAQLSNRNTSSQNKKRITKNLDALVKNLPAQRRLCKQESTRVPEETPTPVVTSTPTPEPTPSSGSCAQPCYNNSRQTGCFGIPSPSLGRESEGQILYATCAGCHVEVLRRNRSFTSIQTALVTIPQMIPFGSNYSSQDIADIAAYLNRYNPKQCRSDWP